MKQLITAIFISFISLSLWATHNRAGEISFWQISSLKYGFRVVTYTKTSAPADRPELEINFSDGTSKTITRISISPILGKDMQKNVYETTHTFAGPAVYKISVSDPNRNQGIINLGGAISVDIPFHIESEVVISAFGGYNTSPVLDLPPVDDACQGFVWFHNPGASDIEGDSLTYELVPSMFEQGNQIATYYTPNGMSINPNTGLITWDSPSMVGEYNIAILIKEYRDGIYMGSMLRDMQIDVKPCNNEPPQITVIADTCVDVESDVTIKVKAWDPDGNGTPPSVQLSGEPLLASTSIASLLKTGTDGDTVFYNFNWPVRCEHLRDNVYNTYFKVTDKDNYANFATLNIKLAGPPPLNPTASPSGSSINLNWDKPICSDVIGYKIYKRADSYGYIPNQCELGVPGYTGYSQIAQTQGANNTSFTDNSSMSVGNQYCYMIVAIYPDGSLSYASEEFCTELKREIPILTHVSITKTNSATGKDTVQWAKPIELDTISQYPGPYSYKIYRKIKDEPNDPYILVGTTPSNAIFSQTDTVYIDSNLNTINNAYEYKIELLSGTISTGVSTPSSSVFTYGIPNDNQIELNWYEEVSWKNYEYDIYRSNNFNGPFTFQATTTSQKYLDTGLVNLSNYCYYIVSKGEYTAPGIISPLINKSQIVCYEPKDTWPPCPPDLVATADCENYENTTTWTNPNNSCTDDVVYYNLYFKKDKLSEFELIDVINSATDTSYIFSNDNVAGCFAVAAVDSFENVSDLSLQYCVDNCPVYELPNVVTPNGDNVNDIFKALEVEFIQKVNFVVFNRWGNEVFRTDKPEIEWNGLIKGMFGNETVLSDGVYYYICDIHINSVEGPTVESLSGTITVLGSDKSTIK